MKRRIPVVHCTLLHLMQRPRRPWLHLRCIMSSKFAGWQQTVYKKESITFTMLRYPKKWSVFVSDSLSNVVSFQPQWTFQVVVYLRVAFQHCSNFSYGCFSRDAQSCQTCVSPGRDLHYCTRSAWILLGFRVSWQCSRHNRLQRQRSVKTRCWCWCRCQGFAYQFCTL